MDVPFTIKLEVDERAVRDDIPRLGCTHYPIRVTLRHHVRDIYHLIWYNSPDYRLKPVFLKITDSDGRMVEDLQLCELLHTSKPVLLEVTGFKLVIDYTLFNSPSIPRRDPVEELFDIVIEWNDARGRTNNIRIRESLACTVGVLKDYVAEERNKSVTDGLMVDGSYFNLRYWADDDVLQDNSMKMSDVLKLDVTPLGPVLFELLYNIDKIVGSSSQPTPSTRFFVKVNSSVPSLQEESSLFEASSRTTIRDFINLIIERADANSVSRTFFDQVKLYHDSELLSQRDLFENTIYEQLNLSEDLLQDRRNVVLMDLVVHEHLSGVEGGILSMEFLNDLRSNSRFQFLPTVRDDLVQTARVDQQSHQVTPIQPTRILLENGVEWHLTGETYEMVQASSLSRFDSGPTQLLVSQSDLASEEFEFTLRLPGRPEPIVVVLNSLQCIVVNQGNHQPYILLSPAASAKLNDAFRNSDGSPCIQQTQIHLYDPNPPSSTRPTPTFQGAEIPRAPDPVENAENRDAANNDNNQEEPQVQQPPPQPYEALAAVLNNGWNFILNHALAYAIILAKTLIFIYAVGFTDLLLSELANVIHITIVGFLTYFFVFKDWRTSHFITEVILAPQRIYPWSWYYAAPLRVLSQVLLFTGFIRRAVVYMMKEELLNYSLSRMREFEHMALDLTGQITPQMKVRQMISETFKLSLLYCITLVPSLAKEAQARLDNWKTSEDQELKDEIERLHAELQELIHQAQANDLAMALEFDIEEVRNSAAGSEDLGTPAEIEVKYHQFLLRNYLQLYVELHKAKRDLEHMKLAHITEGEDNNESASTEEQNLARSVHEQAESPETVPDCQFSRATGSRTLADQDFD